MEYQPTPRHQAKVLKGPNGPEPQTLEDMRTYYGLPRDEFMRICLRSMTGQVASDKIYDLVIIGAGPGGAYTAYRAHKEFPGKKVKVIEKSERIGGRLYSVNHQNKVKEELGGMRIFPSVMKNLVQLIEECHLTLQPVGLGDAHNFFYYKGKRYEKGKFTVNGRTPGQMADACVAAYTKEFPTLAAGDPYESPVLKALSVTQFFKKYGATDEEVEAWVVYSGYDLYPDNVTASIFVKDGELYGPKLSDEQKYVAEGFNELVKQMLQRSKAKVEMRRKVVSVEKNQETGLFTVYSCDHWGRHHVVHAHHVMASLPLDQMKELMSTSCVSEARKGLLQCVQMLPLFKAFMPWERDRVWWLKKGLTQGKSTTDLPLRQVHYYDETDLLIYNSGINAFYWKHEFEHDPKGATRKMFEMLKELHNMPDMPEPVLDTEILHKFWPDGSHKWKKDVDIEKTMKNICVEPGSKFYLCGDAISGYQGWVIGALQTADICWEDMKMTL